MKQLIVLFIIAFTTSSLYSQVNSNSDLKHTKPVTRELGLVDGYLEHLPPGYHNSNKKYPLIVYLHGTGERGNGSSDLYKIAKVGDPSRRAEENGKLCFTVNGTEHCFIVISPQLNHGSNWTSASQERFWDYIMNKSGYRIDRERVYLTGHSLGGNGVWEAAYSDYNAQNMFAAIAPLSYWSNTSKVCKVAERKIPVWAFCGEWDGKFINQSRAAINTLKSCSANNNAEIKLTIVPKSGHSITGPTYRVDHSVYNPNLYEWMLTKKRGAVSNEPKAPDTPGQVKATTKSSSTIEVTWDDKSYNEDGFKVERSETSGDGYKTVGTVGANKTSFTDNGLAQSTKYYYKLRAYNNAGNSAYTSATNATTSGGSSPAPGGDYITWTNIHGAVQNGPDLKKTASHGWGNSGAQSTRQIGANADGWIEMTIEDDSKTDVVFGLSDANPNDNITSTDYGFELSKYNRAFWKRENSSRKYLGTYNEGDVLRIERSGSSVTYKKNGQVLSKTSVSSRPSLLADVALLSTEATVFSGKLSTSSSSGDLPPGGSGYINWVNINGAVQNGNNLEKTGSYGWGNSGAESSQSIPSNSDGWIEMAIVDGSKTDMVFGLSASNPNDNIASTDYGFELSRYNRAFWTRETSSRKYLGTFQEGDILRVERSGSKILYKQNGRTIASTNVGSRPSLKADVTLLNTGTTIFNGKISSSSPSSGDPAASGYVDWIKVHGAVLDGNNLKKTSGYGWGNSGAESSQSIASNADGWLEMVISDPEKANLAFGLSSSNANDRPETIDYGFELSKYNRAYWKRENNSRQYLGTFSKGDVLKIERQGNSIIYKKNGQTVASTVVTSRPQLVADACMVNKDATVFQAKISSNGSGARTADELAENEEDVLEEQKVLIYPNPVGANGRINVDVEGYDQQEGAARFMLYDLNGMLVLDEPLNSPSTAIAMENLSQSMYTYRLMIGGQKVKSGLIKR